MRFKKTVLFFSLICLILSSWGCSKGNKPSEPQNLAQETEITATDNRDDTTTEEATMVETISQTYDFSAPAFCDVEFSVDSTHSVTANYTPHQETTLELTDATGVTWQLVVPPYSISQPITLKMTLLSDIQSADAPVTFSSGLLLEPDGLRFLTPATLIIKSNQLEDPVVLTGSNQGKDMDFIYSIDPENGFQVEHFSSLVASESGSLRMSTTLSDLEKKVLENERQILAMVQKFLKDNAGSIETPTPPALTMTCQDEALQEANGKNLQKFIDDAYEPEGLLLRMLLKAQYEKQVLGIQDINEKENQRLIDKILFRLQKKALLLMDTYKGQSDYLLPIANFALKVAKDIALVGSSEEWPEEKISAQMGDWIATALDSVIQRIKEEHDFREMDVAVKVATWAGILGTDITDKLWREIGKAMTFELKLQVLYKTGESEYFIESIFPVSYTDLNFPLVLKGNGQPNFTFSTSESDISFTATPNPVNIALTEFNPCEGKGTLVLDRFYANAETGTIEEGSVPTNITQKWWEFCYGDYKVTRIDAQTEFVFPFALHNLNETVVNEIIEGKNNSGGQMTIEFNVQLTHKPK